MKKLILLSILLAFGASTAYGQADANLPELTEAATIATTDILYIVLDPNGTPVDRKVERDALIANWLGSTAITTLGTIGTGTWNASDIALGTKTSGNYVLDVADGTGIDGTAAAEGATYTPSFDATELTGLTWSAGGSAAFNWIFNVSTGTDPNIQFGNAIVNLTQGAWQQGGVGLSLSTHDHSAVYQPLEATLTDIADGTIAENLVNTANPWAADEITEADPLALKTAGTDNVKDTHIDWGTGAGQVNPADFANQDIGDITITTGDWAVENDSHTHSTYQATDPNLTGIAAVNWASGQFVQSSGSGNFAGVTANAGTDITADLEEESHASEHAVSGADTVFPSDPGSDKYLMWDDDPGALVWQTIGGGGDMLKATYDTADNGYVDANDTIYGASWNGKIDAASMNAVYDKIQAINDHASVTVVDSQSVNLTLSTQQITADVNDKDYGDVVVSLTGSSWAVDDDSHAHTTTTISGIDISGDTNLAGDTEIVLTGDVLSIGAAITRDSEVPGLETNAAVDSEAELEAILGIGFGASKAATSGYVLVADGTDFESVVMSGDVTIAAGGATAVGDDSHAHTTTTVSGLDISDDTNLGTAMAAIDLLLMSGDAVDANTAAVANGDTKHLATGDQIYDFVLGLGYQAGDPNLTGLAAVNWTNGQFVRSTGSGNFEGVTANAGTNITADLEEEVTEGSLADSTIISADIKDGTIAGGDLATNIAITSTGAQDYGGATTFEIPNVAGNVTLAVIGQVAVDSTNKQLAVYDGVEKAIPLVHTMQFHADLAGAWDIDAEWQLLDMDRGAGVFPNGIVITSWYVDCSVADPTTELNANLYYCDALANGAFPGANPVLVDVIDTTTGNSSCVDMSGSDLGSGVIPTAKIFYVLMDADPTDANRVWSIIVNYYIPEG